MMCRIFRVSPYAKGVVSIAAIVIFLLAGAMRNPSWAQEPRPTLTPVPTATTAPVEPTPTPVPTVSPETAAPGSYNGPLLKGRVIDLATAAPVSGATVVFSTGGIEVSVVSDGNGEYVFSHLGAANGVLNVVPRDGSRLRPATKDVAVQTRTGVETVVNLGVRAGANELPPLVPTVHAAPDYVSAGGVMTVTVLVENTLPDTITGAMVTNWLPQQVTPLRIRSSTGNPYFSGNLAVVELGTLDAGSAAVVEIAAQVNGGGAPVGALQGTVSFFYRENTAAQASSLTRTNGVTPTVLPVTGIGGPYLGLALLLIVVVVGWMRRRMGRRSPTM